MGATPQAVSGTFPVEYNKNFVKQIDVTFLIIFCACALVLGSTILILSLRPLPEISEEEIQKIQERYAQLVLNQPKKQVQEAIKEVETPVQKTTQKESDESKEVEKKKVDRKNESVKEKKQRKAASRVARKQKREAIQKQLQSSGIFAAITASGGGGTGPQSAISDLLSTSDGVGGLEGMDISQGSFATKNVTPQMLQKRRGQKTSGVGIAKQDVGTASGTEFASVGKVNISSAPPKLSGESVGKGSRTMDAINRVINRYIPRFKKVYETMLKRDPNLKGKLQIQFTIQPDGSVTGVSVIKSTTNNPTFDKRIVSYIKRIKFPPISGGSPIEVVYPFVFSGSS